jgi:hypothetical protein
MSEKSKQFVLPESLISLIDLSRTMRELVALDESLYQANLRAAGEPTAKVNRSSRILEDIAASNGVSLLDAGHRSELIAALKNFDKNAQRIHMSFAVEPSAKFTRNIIIWLRQNIHPLLLLEIGLQPTLAAGVMVRTNNKVFDMSLRHHFAENRHLLYEKITAFKDTPPAAAPKPERKIPVLTEPQEHQGDKPQ